MELEKVSEWSYILVVIIAIVMGLVVGYMAWSGSVGAIDGWVMLIMLILGTIIGGGIGGRLVGFYPIESSITAGLCMANMGGTGDVAVLSSSDRMELMPFAQISSRIGGAFILILASTLLRLFI